MIEPPAPIGREKKNSRRAAESQRRMRRTAMRTSDAFPILSASRRLRVSLSGLTHKPVVVSAIWNHYADQLQQSPDCSEVAGIGFRAVLHLFLEPVAAKLVAPF